MILKRKWKSYDEEEGKGISISPFLDALIMHSKIFGFSVGLTTAAGLTEKGFLVVYFPAQLVMGFIFLAALSAPSSPNNITQTGTNKVMGNKSMK